MASKLIKTCVAVAVSGVVVILGLSGVGPAAAAPSPTPAVTVVGGCDGAKLVQPLTLSSIYCGDAGVIVTNVTWLAWTDTFAAGFGTENRKLCKPSCAAGKVASYPVGIWLFAPKEGAFTQVSLYSSITGPPETYQLTGYVR
ncbi:hypothetical protein RD149_06215 [Gordonia westfalica]|uniref:Lipoprotein n=1 Tax=Gordonia westfalica TaxID=158898 RepID=A0ABU2GPG5_9ACTN|nr:hypothetical protein [Gordonia westfalica]MDS1113357.1 hypothetical protein [Gordonia westfalica]